MARVSGPFMSLDASGTVGKLLTACKWKGRNYMRQYFIPENPNSSAQQSVRLAVSKASYAFAVTYVANQGDWNTYAEAYNNSGVAIWMKRAIDAWMDQHGTTEQPLSLSVSDPDTPADSVFTWTEVT